MLTRYKFVWKTSPFVHLMSNLMHITDVTDASINIYIENIKLKSFVIYLQHFFELWDRICIKYFYFYELRAMKLKSKISKKLKKKKWRNWYKLDENIKKLNGIEMKYGFWNKQKHRLAIYSRFFKACSSKLLAFTGDGNFNGVFSWKSHAKFK